MYAPGKFEVTDRNELEQFVRNHPFGMLLSNGYDGFPLVSHLPFVVKNTAVGLCVEMHLALENPHAQLLNTGATAKLVVSGPHGYISSTVYTHINVPTYNYAAVHLVGLVEVLSPDALKLHLEELVNQFEAPREQPLDFNGLPSEMIESYSKEIVGIRLNVIRFNGVFKLSQNRNDEDFGRIVDDLNEGSVSEKELAAAMKQAKCPMR